MPEYKFSVGECACGRKLSGKKVELVGMKGPIPMGRCSKCGIAYPLVEVKSKPVKPTPELEPEVKPPAEEE